MLVLALAPDDVEAAQDWLWGLGAIAIEERPASSDDGTITVVAGFDDDDAALAARSVIGERWPTRFEQPPDESEWRDVWLKHLGPVAVGPLVIHPPWQPPEDSTLPAISIDPGRAFGSGQHPSTQLAVRALAEVLNPGDRVIDVGCGTGVLSIASVALGAKRALGIDLDHDIIEVARANADANGLGDQIKVTTTALQEVGRSCDVVAVNITCHSLLPLVPSILELADRDVVVSGLLADQQPLLEAAFGIDATQEWTDGEWRSLHFDLRSPEVADTH